MFISFEGIDGSGKTTQIILLKNRLEQQGHEVLVLREPGGTELSENIRTLLLDKNLNIVPFAEMLLFSAARAQLVELVIRPALTSGKIVLCDRFFDSTIAYQGYGRKVALPEWLKTFQLEVTQHLVPDRTYYIDVPLEISRSRQQVRDANNQDRMEKAGQSFFLNVIDAYQQLAKENPNRFKQIDGTLSVEAIHTHIWQDLVEIGRIRNLAPL